MVSNRKPNRSNVILAIVMVVITQPGAALGSPQGKKSKPISLEGWPSETFPLPPPFAPKLPKGTESLRFAPGWRKPDDDGFWSYAFVMWIEEPTPGKKQIESLLEAYYDGLLASFAQGQKKDISSSSVRIHMTQKSPGKYEAQMHAVDAFATFRPIKVRVEIESVALGRNRSSLRMRLSPQPKKHPIWKSLKAATADILAKNKSLEAKS